MEKYFKSLAKSNQSGKFKASSKIFKYIKYRLTDPNVEWDGAHHFWELAIKGLGSDNENARRCHFALLSTQLSRLPIKSLTFGVFIDIVNKVFNDEEKTDDTVSIGRALAYGSLIYSEAIMQEPNENQKFIIDHLLGLSNMESLTVHHISLSFIIMYLSKVTKETYKTGINKSINKDIIKSKDSLSLDQLRCLFILKSKFNCNKLFKRLNIGPDFSHESTVQFIVNTLMNCSTLDEHPVHDEFCQYLSSNDEIIPIYWSVINAELINNPTYFKEVIMLKIFCKLLDNINTTKHLPSLLTKQLINVIFKRKKKYYKHILTCLEKLESSIRSIDNKIKLLVLKKLLLYPGNLAFDQLSGSKTIRTIVNNLNSEGVQEFSNILRLILSWSIHKVDASGLETTWTDKDLYIAAHMYGRLIIHSACSNLVEWRRDQLIKLVEFGFFHKHTTISSENAGIIRNVFFKTVKHPFPHLFDYIEAIKNIVQKINKKVDNNIPLRVKFSPQTLECWRKAIAHSLDLDNNKFQLKSVFQVIILHMALLLLKEPIPAQEALMELFSIMKKMYSHKKTNDDEPHWMEVLVDLFMELLSRNVKGYRHIVRCVYKHTCSYLNLNALSQMLKVLDPQYKYKEVSAEEDSEIMEQKESDCLFDEENASDQSESENFIDEVSETSLEEVDSFNTLTSYLADKIASDEMPNNSDNESMDLDELNDEEGEELNAVLGNLFKSQNKSLNSSINQQYEEELMHFRIRTLDMIEIFFESRPSPEMVLKIIPALFGLLEYCIKERKSEALYFKLRGCFNKLSTLKNLPDSDEMVFMSLVEELESLLSRNRMNPVTISITPQILDFFKFVLRICSAKSSCIACITGILLNEIKYFFEIRANQLSLKLVEVAISGSWEGIIDLMPDFARFTYSQFTKQNNAIILLHNFVKNGRCFNERLSKKYSNKFKELEQIISRGAEHMLNRVGNHEYHERFDFSLFNTLFILNKYKWFNIEWKSINKCLAPLVSHLPSLRSDYQKKLKRLCCLLVVKNVESDIQAGENFNICPSGSNLNRQRKRKRRDEFDAKKRPNV